MRILAQVSFVLILVALIGCNNKTTSDKEMQTMDDSTSIDDELPIAEEVPSDSAVIHFFGIDYTERNYEYAAPSINIFRLESTEKENIAFTSLSDIHKISEHIDSMALPSLSGLSGDELNSIALVGKYREQFLASTGVSESDSVYVYDYENNKLHSFAVNALKTVANISPYDSGEDASSLSQYSYRFGFAIDAKVLQPTDEYFQHTFVYVGRSNPFALEKLVPITWTQMEDSKFPSKKIQIDDVPHFVGVNIKHSYVFEKYGLEYYIQMYRLPEYGNEISRLIVLDKKTGAVVADEIFGGFEGSEPRPLNFIEAENTDVMQWTGRLLRGKAPVIFGLEYTSFGCSHLSVLDKAKETIYINCDNRH